MLAVLIRSDEMVVSHCSLSVFNASLNSGIA